MRNSGPGKKLAALPLAVGLLVSSGFLHAAEVCLDGDTAVGIKNLQLDTIVYGSITIDVDFRYTTGFDIYGNDLNNLPYGTENGEDDSITTMLAINDLLSDLSNVPGSVGQPGQSAFFIGGEREVEGSVGLLAAPGGENLTGNFWDACSRTNNCVLGIATLNASDRHVYADLKRASGGNCPTGSQPPVPPPEPPPESFNITAGISGTWWDPNRDGEGYVLEVIGSSLDPILLVYYYTYDDMGNPIYLVGSAAVDGNSAVVPVVQTSGPVFGDGYDKDDVVRDNWGTLTFTFTSCGEGTMEYNSTVGFGQGTINIVRFTTITGLACP